MQEIEEQVRIMAGGMANDLNQTGVDDRIGFYTEFELWKKFDGVN